ANVTLSWSSKAYNGAVQKPTVTVKSAAGTTLAEGTSYTVTYSTGCKKPGTYTVTITAKGSYFSGTVEKTFRITKQKLAASRVTLSATSFTYNAKVQKPTVTVKNAQGKVLTEGTSYTVTYSSGCKNTGTYTVTVTAKGSYYTGTVKKTFKINAQALAASRVTLSATSFTYNGKVQKPTVTVKNAAGYKLTEGTHYTVAWSGACKAKGTYTVTITGTGNYTGTVKKTFKIV
ncbi:MAG: MBG domain-containing protein, partial [Clostridia bacterium]|nr:MBG domain-containing protein [Clostridia bacterium]